MASEFRYSTKNPRCAVAYTGFAAMHTRVEVVLAGVEETAARELTAQVEADVKRMEKLFNRFDDTSPLSAVNARAAREDVEVCDELFMALELCRTFCRATGGYFDVAASSSSARRSPQSAVASYMLDASAHKVRFTSGDVRLDLGGFAKGYALEQVRRRLCDEGVEGGVINFGNSSIAAIGHHPYGEWWPIGVAHTKLSSLSAREYKLCDSALSVSGRAACGDYHIINPHTGAAVAGEELVVVEGRSGLVCEVLSTALYAMPKSERAAVMKQFAGYTAEELYCRDGGACEVFVVSEGQIH